MAIVFNYYSLFLDILQFIACLWALYYAFIKHRNHVYIILGFVFLLLYALVDLVDFLIFKTYSGEQALDIVNFVLIVLATLSFMKSLKR